jgi:hypothetical protein
MVKETPNGVVTMEQLKPAVMIDDLIKFHRIADDRVKSERSFDIISSHKRKYETVGEPAAQEYKQIGGNQ